MLCTGYRRVGETVQNTSERGITWSMAGNLTTVVIILTVGEYVCKTDFVQNKLLKIITESKRARAHVCVCVYIRKSIPAITLCLLTVNNVLTLPGRQ